MLQEPRLPAAQAVRTQENKHENNSLLSGAERSQSPQRHRMICGAPGRGSRRSPAAAFHRAGLGEPALGRQLGGTASGTARARSPHAIASEFPSMGARGEGAGAR